MPDLASLFVFPLMLVFIRVGACLMTFPGYSDLAVNTRARLLLAIFVSLALFPILEDKMPIMPESTSVFLMLLLTELVLGVLMAVGARIFMGTMHVAGEMIAFTSGLQAATLFDPRSGASTSAPGLFLGMMAAVLVFATGLHLFIIEALVESYNVFAPGDLPDLGDVAQAVASVVADMFLVGVKIAAPVVAIGSLSYAGFGVFNRLIPQLQVFFVALPLTIVIGLLMLGLTLGSVVILFTDQMQEHAILFTQDESRF